MLVALACLGACSQRTIDIPPDDTALRVVRATELADKAQAAEKDGKLDDAVNYYKQSVAVYPSYYPAWNNLGVLLMERDSYAAAAEAFGRAAEVNPTDPRPLHNIALIYLNRGYDREAADYFTRALGRDSGYLPSLREAVRLDVRADRITDVTSERIAKALLLETDPKWLELLRRYKPQIDRRLAAKEGTEPPAPPAPAVRPAPPASGPPESTPVRTDAPGATPDGTSAPR